MNEKQYLQKRNELIDKAQRLINAGKLEDAEKIQNEIRALDDNYQNQLTTEANLKALTKNSVVCEPFANSTNINFCNTEDIQNYVYDTTEYRTAFMNYVCGKTNKIIMNNQSEVTKTTDVGAVIPTTIMNTIIEKLESVGMILPLVTRTNYKGGLSVPTSTVKPTATWVSEGSGSDKQKKTTSSVVFNYYKLCCRIAFTLETTIVTLPMFESRFVAQVVEAMEKALEDAIVNGTGIGQPTGILASDVVQEQTFKVSNIDYATLINIEAAIPVEYEANAVWFMTKKTYYEFLKMTDANGQPIARVNYGIGGKPERTLLGRNVVIIPYLKNYGVKNKVFAFIFNPKDYILNTNLNMTTKQYEDNDTDDTVIKCYALYDGKVVDNGSLVTITYSDEG